MLDNNQLAKSFQHLNCKKKMFFKLFAKNIIQNNYLKKWKNLHCIQVEKLIDREINKLNAEKIMQKQTIDDEKMVNFGPKMVLNANN